MSIKLIYKLGFHYIDISKIYDMTKPYCSSEYQNPNGQVLKDCSVFINGKEYRCKNYVESYSAIVTDEEEKFYQEFVEDVNKLFIAYISM